MNAVLTRLMIVPLVSPSLPDGVGSRLNTLTSWVMGIGYGVAVIAVIIAGIIMMFRNDRGQGSDAVGRLGFVAAGAILIGVAGTVVKALM